MAGAFFSRRTNDNDTEPLMPDETTEITTEPKYTRENTPDAFAAVLAIANELAGLKATMEAAFFVKHGDNEGDGIADRVNDAAIAMWDKDGRSVADTLTRIYLDGAG